MKSPKRMLISRWWLQGALLTYLVGFTILGILAYLVYDQQPPIPGRFISRSGKTLFSSQDIMDGMHVFERYGLMEYGTIYGHGAYLGPDFTADYIHRSALFLIQRRMTRGESEVAASAEVSSTLHQNTFDKGLNTVVWDDDRAEAHENLVDYYQKFFASTKAHAGAQADWIKDPREIRKLTAFFAWTAWTATADRPNLDYSYTNNWPPERLAGNTLTPQAITWSAISIITLLCGTGIILFFFGRYDWLGWKAIHKKIKLIPPDEIPVTASQRAVLWFFLVAALLFVLQTFLGGLSAHYRAEPTGFFGWDISRLLPYNIARTWHLQLSIFWVAACYLAAGIFITPFISGSEPQGQALLTKLLVMAVGIVVAGSLCGEFLSVKGMITNHWFWIGQQGWEYLDLGRFWQILLIIGLFLWVFILRRGLRETLNVSSRGNLPWLLFYSALTIPAFYAVGLLTSRDHAFVISDFWRFWVVHLWVEDFLELFTTVIVAYIFVLLGMVLEETAIRVIYLDIILYSVGGVVGTMHHLYFSGAPAIHMALGAAFSAMEVIPLLLLTLEAWAFMRSGESMMPEKDHPHRWAVWFLIAVGVWNFLGAGVFGFLINLPMVSYYEIGTNLTANHAHTSMMGVYGMLAVGLMLFAIRYLTQADKWSNKAAKISFWSLNVGLAWMSFVNLFPEGIVQLRDSLALSYFHARSPEFFSSRWVNVLEWLRLPGDILFILGGTLPLLYLCLQAIRHPKKNELELSGASRPIPLFIDLNG